MKKSCFWAFFSVGRKSVGSVASASNQLCLALPVRKWLWTYLSIHLQEHTGSISYQFITESLPTGQNYRTIPVIQSYILYTSVQVCSFEPSTCRLWGIYVSWDFDVCLSPKRCQAMLWCVNTRVNSYQRWKQTRNRVCFHLWCELTLALWCHSIVWSLFSWNKM